MSPGTLSGVADGTEPDEVHSLSGTAEIGREFGLPRQTKKMSMPRKLRTRVSTVHHVKR